MNKQQMTKKILTSSGMLVGACVLSFALNGKSAFAHGYIENSRAHLAKQGINVNAGPVQYEPQSVEALGNFPVAGPADGQIAGAGIYSELDEQTATRWAKIPVQTGKNTFTWTMTAPHRTTEYKYYITKDGWDPNAPITRDDLELITVVDGFNEIPERTVNHVVEIPANKEGYHVILGVWEIADTGNAFYQVVDVDVQGGGDIVVDTEAPTTPMNLISTGQTVNSIALAWDKASDNIGVHHYDIYRNGEKVGTTTSTQFTDTELMADTAYSYTVKAIDAAGNESLASTATLVRTQEAPAVDAEAPTAPSNLHSMGETESTVNLMWRSSTDNVGIAHYNVYRNGSLIATVTGTMFLDTNLEASTEYTYTVEAVDFSHNVSEMSNVLVVTTSEKDEIVDPEEPEVSGTWNKETTYLMGDVVTYNGLEYRAKWWTQGEKPGESNAWELVTTGVTTEWNSTIAYNGGDEVVYNGQVYRAKWWTQGDNPANSTVWELVGGASTEEATTEWNALASYIGGEEITYNGQVYRAKWWTQGDNPELSDVWVRL